MTAKGLLLIWLKLMLFPTVLDVKRNHLIVLTRIPRSATVAQFGKRGEADTAWAAVSASKRSV